MYPEFEALASGNGQTRLRARFKVGGDDSNTYIDVKGEDSLIGTVGKQEKTLKEVDDELFGADFDEDKGGTAINIALDRGEQDDGAPESTAELPEPFALELLSNKIIRRGEPIKFSWAPAAEPGKMNWKLDSDCTFLADGQGIGDDGEFSVPAKEHKQVGKDDEKECKATLIVDRVLNGTVDDVFDDGEFVAIQRRTVTFTSVGPDAAIEGEPTEEPDAGAGATDTDSGTKVPAETDGGSQPPPEESDAGVADADAGASDAGVPAADAGK